MITFPNKAYLELMAPARNTLFALRDSFVLLQSYWIEYGFSTADLVGNEECWNSMRVIAQALPRKDNPAIYGFDLDLLQTDLIQIEELFLTQDKSDISAYRVDDELTIRIFIDEFRGCKILEFCRFEPRLVLQDAHALYRKRMQDKADLEALKVESAPAPAPESVTESPVLSNVIQSGDAIAQKIVDPGQADQKVVEILSAM